MYFLAVAPFVMGSAHLKLPGHYVSDVYLPESVGGTGKYVTQTGVYQILKTMILNKCAWNKLRRHGSGIYGDSVGFCWTQDILPWQC